MRNFKHILLLGMLALWACDDKSEKADETTPAESPVVAVAVPDFSADSAYQWVATQVAFGPRTPGSKAHTKCADYLVAELRRFTPEVMEQNANIKAHDGKVFRLRNIIASFHPEAEKRVVLAAHWDTRPRADQDDERQNEPIDGANDGGSGVGVLLEIARQLAAQPTKVGVDIVLFDLEDYGHPDSADSYCLGSQHWSANPHKAGYKAHYGILLDMVGARDAQFFMEGFSMYYAPHVMRKVWNHAFDLGYKQHFTYQQSSGITDDHYYVNKIAGIPMIDIIQHDPTTPTGFGAYWHTHDDVMEGIDKNTLKAVGQTVLYTLYHE